MLREQQPRNIPSVVFARVQGILVHPAFLHRSWDASQKNTSLSLHQCPWSSLSSGPKCELNTSESGVNVLLTETPVWLLSSRLCLTLLPLRSPVHEEVPASLRLLDTAINRYRIHPRERRTFLS